MTNKRPCQKVEQLVKPSAVRTNADLLFSSSVEKRWFRQVSGGLPVTEMTYRGSISVDGIFQE
jgi:hypothetical protein